MRKVTSWLFISLDGITESPHEWQFDVFDDAMSKVVDDAMAETDTVLLGRVTYQEWADYWVTSTDEPFATYINSIPKYVFSTTLNQVAWQNSTLVKGDLAETIHHLKQQPGKTITVNGSPGLVQSMLQNNLLDELTLLIHPVIAGKGKGLFNSAHELKQLKLVDSLITTTGVAILTYQPRTDD